jgi:dienelactone hydrolase
MKTSWKRNTGYPIANMLICLLLASAITTCKTNVRAGDAVKESTALRGDLSKPGASNLSTETITITTSDNVVLYGTLYRARVAKSPAVLCLHQWRNDRSSYRHLAEKLCAEGITVLSIDMRGHGASVKKKDGSIVSPDRVALPDVDAAVQYLRQLSGIDHSRIGIIGASYGASNAFIHAATDEGIKAVALLSPGLNYFNALPMEPAFKSYGARPLMAVASSEDQRSVEAVEKLKKVFSGKIITEIYENAGHGTEILETNAASESLISAFFAKNL